MFIKDPLFRTPKFEGLDGVFRIFIQTMAKIMEIKDQYTLGHQYRVADLADQIALRMGLESPEREGLKMAALIHDLGKIYIPAEILCKPVINQMELQLVRTHVQIGYDIIKDIPFPWPVAQIVLEHHERYNGSGYPEGRCGLDICKPARILAVADSAEAIASHRPYRAALGIEKALHEMDNNRGILYDPDVVDMCLDLFLNQGYVFPEYTEISMANMSG